MHVHAGNRMEEIAAALSEVVGRGARSPFTAETIVVQSRGMERWLSMELGRRLGVWAGGRFPFPRAFVEEVFSAVLGEDEAAPAFTREQLTWSIAALLPDLAGRPELGSVSGYLEDDPRGLKRFQLARRIAHVFDQYAVYRPEMVLAWERGEGEDWQAVLWRSLSERHGRGHVARRAALFFERWAELEAVPEAVPERVCLFGVSSLPPVYLEVLAALAERREVHLFCLTPCRDPRAPEQHPLCASLGTVGGELRMVLEQAVRARGAAPPAMRELFVEPDTGSMLRALQSDILAGRRLAKGGDAAAAPGVSPEDRSISVSCTHGPTREVEVLRDALLGMFEEDPTLMPHDVVVMAPDIDAYAPLVDAVLGVAPDEPGYIPYRIADRSSAGLEAAQALLRMLELFGGRMKATEVLDLLQLEPVRDRFDIDALALPEIRRIVAEAGVRWGVDASDRVSAGQPPFRENTWRFGLERLLLGHAMPGNGRRLFAGALPCDDVEGDTAELVGRLVDFCETLFTQRDRLLAPRAPAEWSEALSALLDATLAGDERMAWQLRALRTTLSEIAAEAEAAGFAEPVHLDAIRALLDERLGEERTVHDFLTGGVTFCAMLPMRSIPFRVVCLLGMNDATFPRITRTPSFDRMARDPRPGDRSTREEDRYLFLEAILSARDRLHVSYVGRDAQSNAEYPPASVLVELLDALDEGTDMQGSGAAPSAAITVEHPLQPFSPRYFLPDRDPRLGSFSAADAEGARALVSRRRAPAPLFRAALPPLEGPRVVSVDELARFFEHPARALLERRLGVRLAEDALLLEDREPLELDPLSQYQVGAALLARALEGEDPGRALDAVRAEGVLPPGTPGAFAYEAIAAEVRAVTAAAAPFRGESLPALEVDVAAGDWRVVGLLGDLVRGAQLRCQHARLRAKTEVSAWVRHLVLCAAGGPEEPRRSVVVGRAPKASEGGAATRVFAPLPAAEATGRLRELLELYDRGMRAPLCFFPEASRAYAGTIRDRKEAPDAGERATKAAKSAFTAVAEDPYVRRVFDGVDPLDDAAVPFDPDGAVGLPSFAAAACTVFLPLLDRLAPGSAEEAAP